MDVLDPAQVQHLVDSDMLLQLFLHLERLCLQEHVFGFIPLLALVDHFLVARASSPEMLIHSCCLRLCGFVLRRVPRVPQAPIEVALAEVGFVGEGSRVALLHLLLEGELLSGVQNRTVDLHCPISMRTGEGRVEVLVLPELLHLLYGVAPLLLVRFEVLQSPFVPGLVQLVVHAHLAHLPLSK